MYLCYGQGQIGGTENSYSVGPRCVRRKPNPKFFARISFKRTNLVENELHSWQDYRLSNHALNRKREARKGSKLTLTRWSSSTAATAVEITVDGDGVLRRERIGDDGDDSETKGAAAMGSGRVTFEEIFNRTVCWEYIPIRCRWHRVEQIGSTETCNCLQLQQLGPTELV